MTSLQTRCSHHGPFRSPPWDVPLIVRVYRWIRGPGKKTRAIHQPERITLRLPAMGDGYHFTVKVRITWCVTGADFEPGLAERITDQRQALGDRLADRLRHISRRYPPYDAAGAEEESQRVVAGICGAVRVRFAGEAVAVSDADADGELRVLEPHTVAQLDETVCTAQQQAWDRRQLAANEHGRALELVRHVAERRRLWHDFLKEIEREWHSPYAAALAQDPDTVGNVVQDMFEDRRDQVEDMTSKLVEQVEQYQALDAFELMTTNDTVLRRMMALLKIPDPPDQPTAPFGDAGASAPNGSR